MFGADGNLYIVDRLKRMIIRPDGFKIFPSLIEDVVVKHPLVQSCKVVGLRDFSFSQGKLPKVHVVLNETDRNPEAIENEILMLCEEQLPEYYWPCEIEFNESLPLTPIGKIDYLKLEKEDYEKQLAATKKLVKK